MEPNNTPAPIETPVVTTATTPAQQTSPKLPLNNVLISLAILGAGALIAGAVLYNGARYGVAKPAGATPDVIAVDIAKVKTDGDPYIGKADAPVVIAYWSDYQCPFCQRHELQVVSEIIKNYVDTGKAKIVFKDFAFLGADSQTIAKYGSAVWEAAPDKFYAWHKNMYESQGQENTGWATKEKLHTLTAAVLGEELTKKVEGLVASKGAEYQKEIEDDRAEGAAVGVQGTPGTVIGKELVPGAYPYATFQAAIEKVLK